MTRELLIVGTSARAAAQSAVLAGWRPCAIDQFADQDLLDCCPAWRVDDYPRGIVSLASRLPHCPFLFTGALENHPETIGQLARQRPLAGNPPSVLRAVRDPWSLRAKLVEQNLQAPEILRPDEPLPPGTWLTKPIRSGGGIGIRRVEATDTSQPRATCSAISHYRQRFVVGDSISAQFVAAREAAVLLGVTRQLVGCGWAGADDFLYVGNIGPLPISTAVARTLQKVGNLLAGVFSLQGLFGVDGILNREEFSMLEVNPRFTAAMEILERSLGHSVLPYHFDACELQRLPNPIALEPIPQFGKAILYARCPVIFPSNFDRQFAGAPPSEPRPVVADVPAAGTEIARRGPICSLFASAPTEAEVVAQLQERARQVYELVELGRA